jgi:hypothetical protein
MQDKFSDDIARASEYWQAGQPLDAGRLIYANLPVDHRPAWAVRILRLVLDRSGADLTPFYRILDTAENPRWWANGHRCFDLLRDATLQQGERRGAQGQSEDQEVLASLLSLAELVAKVTYNAVDPLDPFDEDSGWWIATLLKSFVDRWNDAAFGNAAWKALTDRSGPHMPVG